jgi:hypothetical protein
MTDITETLVPLTLEISDEANIESSIESYSPEICSICTMGNFEDMSSNNNIRDPKDTNCRFVTECGHTFHQGCWLKYFDNKISKYRTLVNNETEFNDWYSIKCPNCRRRSYIDGLSVEHEEEYLENLAEVISTKINRIESLELSVKNQTNRFNKLLEDYNGMKKNYSRMCEYLALESLKSKEKKSTFSPNNQVKYIERLYLD